MKTAYLTKKLCVFVVNAYADTGFSIFAIEYLHENEKVYETAFSLFIWGPPK